MIFLRLLVSQIILNFIIAKTKIKLNNIVESGLLREKDITKHTGNLTFSNITKGLSSNFKLWNLKLGHTTNSSKNLNLGKNAPEIMPGKISLS